VTALTGPPPETEGLPRRRRLGVVVQRYGDEIAGGAEYHARLIAEMLAQRYDVTVFTTCALDYITWANHYPPGSSELRGVRIERFPCARFRSLDRFAALSRAVDAGRRGRPALTSTAEPVGGAETERAWMDEQGPFSPALRDRVAADSAQGAQDAWIFFSYRYWTTACTLPHAGPNTLLVPTAEDDGLYRLPVFGPTFAAASAWAFNSPEERSMLERTVGHALRGLVVGVGSALPRSADGERFRRDFNIRGAFLLYVGRVDNNKGFPELFDHFLRYRRETGSSLRLVLIGRSILEIPQDEGIVMLGFQPDQVKWDALHEAVALAVPSRYESLSMATLEAFYAGTPALANANCAVLRGQCRRSGGGLYFANGDEFVECLARLEKDPALRRRLGAGGRSYFDRHYSWSEIEQKYENLLEMAMATTPTDEHRV
jgi:glycosyltransferase involved in cell wall biosynthesis